MEKSLIICMDDNQAAYAKTYLEQQGATVTIEKVDVTVSEAEGTPPTCNFVSPCSGKMLVVGIWQ